MGHAGQDLLVEVVGLVQAKEFHHDVEGGHFDQAGDMAAERLGS